MRVLVVGSGGREHAICAKLARDAGISAVWCAPGSAGIAQDATCVDVAVTDLDGLVEAARAQAVDIVVVGPEAPLVAGLVDRLDAAGIPVLGPTAAAAQLEGSKAFTKDLCARVGIPTAAYGRFSEPAGAKAFAEDLGAPLVVKADGLAAGKGVVIAETMAAAHDAIDGMLTAGRFGDAGAEIVVEAFLEGEEISLFALSDGAAVVPFGSAQDHKRAFDGDQGPNTGGMGAYGPAPRMDDTLTAEVMHRIIHPTVAEMARMGMPFRGFLFAGLILTDHGPQLLEYNVRLGDPEAQVVLGLLNTDMADILGAVAKGSIADLRLDWADEVGLSVVMATNGYPGAYVRGSEIAGVEDAAARPGVRIYHAGTSGGPGAWRANGGRVLNVVGTGPDFATARERAYGAVDAIDWPDGFCRRDIGWRVVGAGG